MKEYNFIAGTLGLIMLCVTLLSCSNEVVTSQSSYGDLGLNEVIWKPDGGGNNGGGTTTPCRLTATSTACPGTGGGTNTGGELVISGSKHCSWLDAGHRHTIFVKEDSLNDPNKIVTVRGLNAHGQLVKDPLYYGSPIAPAMKTDLEWPAGEVPIMLSGHRRHVCYQFNKTGQVKCYGEDGNKAPVLGDNSGQILDGTHSYQSLKITAGRNHNAMLLADGRITTWGSNAWGQLGTGDAYVDGAGIQEYSNAVTYLKIKDSNGNVSVPTDWINVAAGHYHTCGIRDNAVWCAGKNDKGQTGNKNYTIETIDDGNGKYVFSGLPSMTDLSFAKKVEGLENPVIVDAGESHTCAIQKNGLVKCWGENDYGQLGDGTTSGDIVIVDPTSPVTVLKEDGSKLLAKALTLGEETSCAIDIEDNLLCWGRALHMSQGSNNNSPRLVATPVAGATNVKQADITWHHLTWLTNGGKVYGQGQNSNQQLRDGNTDDIGTAIELFTSASITSREHGLMRTYNW